MREDVYKMIVKCSAAPHLGFAGWLHCVAPVIYSLAFRTELKATRNPTLPPFRSDALQVQPDTDSHILAGLT